MILQEVLALVESSGCVQHFADVLACRASDGAPNGIVTALVTHLCSEPLAIYT